MAKWWQSSKSESTGASQNTPLNSDNNTPMPNWYRNIHELPLKRFETCIVDGNLAALVISGFPSPDDLAAAWKSIINDYSDMMGNAEYKVYTGLFKEVAILKITYDQISIILSVLRKQYVPYFCDELRELLSVNFPFDTANMEQYDADLDRCERRSKAIKIRLDLKQAEFDAIEAKFSKEGKVQYDHNFFISVLIKLSKHNGYKITNDITVAEYCNYMKEYKKYFETEYKS